MRLSTFCIERPVFSTVLSLVIIAIGLISFGRLDMRYAPKVNKPELWVYAEWPGASAEVIENNITRPLEDSIASLSGIENLTSTSSNGKSEVRVKFKEGGETNLLQEISDVRNAISKANLPEDIKAPEVETAGHNGDMLMILTVQDPNRNASQLRDYVERYLKNTIEEVPGVAQAQVFGGGKYAVRIWLDPARMAERGITVHDIEQLIQNNNLDLPAGTILGPDRNFSVTSNTRLKSLADFRRLVINAEDGHVIRLTDVAKVTLGSETLTPGYMWVNNQPAIGIQVSASTEANPILVANSLKRELEVLSKTLPPQMQVQVGIDMSKFLQDSVREVYITIVEAVLLVVLFVFLFLGSFRAALIPIVTIPVCLIGAFAVMLSLGFTINVFTLLAIVLAIGLVVDDAIVVLENCYRHVESGMSSMEAAVTGSREIGFAVIGMTITLAAVYAPIGFMHGFSAVLFREFSYTLAGAVILSGFVALTLSPMMCSRFLKPATSSSRFAKGLDALFFKLNNHYEKALGFVLAKRKWVVLLFVLLVASIGWILSGLSSTLIPKEDIGVMGLSMNAPTGASLEYTQPYVRQINKLAEKLPETSNLFTFGGWGSAGSAFTYANLINWRQRSLSTAEVVDKMNETLKQIAGVNANAFNIPPPLARGGGSKTSDVSFHLMSSSSYSDLGKEVDKLSVVLKALPDISDVDSSLKFDSQEYALNVKRDVAAELGVSVRDIATTLATMIGGEHVTDFQAGSDSYPIYLQVKKDDLRDLSVIKKLYVPSSSGAMIPLANLIRVTPTVSLKERQHFARMRTVEVTAQIAPNYTLGDVIASIEKVAPKSLADNSKIEFTGAAKRMIESRGSSRTIFVLAIVFIYLALAALFESFIDPLIILLTVPLCIIGALLLLKLINGSLNLYTNIALITLVGLVSKHGILITQFANAMREKTDSLFDAVTQAAIIRLRPILMTTVTMVSGALPLALATGPGSASRQQMGWVIVGGLLIGTFFSLFIVPVAYTLLKAKKA